MFSNYDLRRFDYILLVLVILLAIIGIVAIGSANRVNSIDGTAYFRNRQIVGYATGAVLMIFFTFFDYHWIGKMSPAVFALNVGLLIAVLLVGKVVNGAQRWILIGPFQLQPSEFAKIFTVLVLAKYIDVFQKRINNLAVLIGAAAIPGTSWVLIFMEPDLSTSLIMIIIFIFMIFVGGISYWYVLGATAIGVPSAMWFFNYIQQPDQKILETYQVRRVLGLIDPTMVDADSYRQTLNSLQAIGSGGLFGKGLYMGKVNQYDYLPEPQTDFIFSIIGEEFGFFGCSIVLLLLFLLVLRLLWIGKDAPDLYGKLIITGYTAVIMYQTFINVGVTTGIAPNTGMTLPFVSYGVSSLWNNLIGIGIILNIGIQRKKTERGST